MEIENAIFQDQESFGKRGDFQNIYGKVLDICLDQKIIKYIVENSIFLFLWVSKCN